MDFRHLRDVLRPLVLAVSVGVTHEELPGACERLGLPIPPNDGSKRDRTRASFEGLADNDLRSVAYAVLALYPPTAQIRNAIQEILWSETPVPAIPKRCRRELAIALDIGDMYRDSKAFDDLLDRIWVLDDDATTFDAVLTGRNRSLRARIEQHVHLNADDWTTVDLFREVGAFDASDHRFFYFLQGLATPEVMTDEGAQRRFVEIVNPILRRSQLEFRESGTRDGYPVFTMQPTDRGVTGRPKNIIFATLSKPDIRFRDAVSNEIEIVSNPADVLVFDRAISQEGLPWRDVQAWWSESNDIPNDSKAKAALYERLRASLPKESPAQRVLFDAFYRHFGPNVPGLPALLPEVWLHWDPRTVEQRGREALLRFRMDFLLLLPFGVRVVVEVDGKHHYSRPDGRADAARYAVLAAADRDLRLSGYEVFRFGVDELRGGSARERIGGFFSELFRVHRVTSSPGNRLRDS